MLKTDFHTHVAGDPFDQFIGYTPKQLIDFASKKGFEVLAITCHEKILYSKNIANYAKKKGILLLPGVERTIEGKHVLLLNFTEEECKKIKTFANLKKYKKSKHLVIAPHPFYPAIFGSPLSNLFFKHKDLFDAIEYSSFWTSMINWPNKKAARVAKKLGLSVLGNSDAHDLPHLNTTYTWVDSKKNIPSVIKAIKNGNVKLSATPLSLPGFLWRGAWMALKGRANLFKRIMTIMGL